MSLSIDLIVLGRKILNNLTKVYRDLIMVGLMSADPDWKNELLESSIIRPEGVSVVSISISRSRSLII